MRFSEHFSITIDAGDDWFDPHLTVDTKLFVDPLLLLEDGGSWADAHEELIKHFVHCYELVAKSTSENSVSAKAARRLLTFPEPQEIGLGYTVAGTNGAGSGGTFAKRIADGIAVAIRAGLSNPQHIEEIGILNEQIGADRISDAVVNILKVHFIKYTQEVCLRHGVPMEKVRVKNVRCNLSVARWIDEEVELPINPFSGKGVILVPSRLLNDLPILNAEDWFDSDLNDDIRTQMNISVGAAVRKADIVQWAQEHPERVIEWAKNQSSRPDLSGYDFGDDPLGVVQWDGESAQWAKDNPLGLTSVTTQDDLIELVRRMLEQFKHFVEEQRGWKLFYNKDGSRKPEEAAQLLFLGMAQPYLRHYNIELDREVELGRGPVDFKASSGTSARILIEMKKEDNGRFWNGLRDQLPSYIKSDRGTHGWYVALVFRDNKGSKQRLHELPGVVSRVADATGATLDYIIVDALEKASASNI